ncbi:hypothetical protein IKS57_02025, partial [bacterium]|nr:hypothetical protein [bacterium]
EAYKLYSDKNDIVEYIQTKSYQDYLEGYDDENGHHKGLKEIVDEIHEKFPDPSKISSLIADEQKKEFVNLETNYLRLINKLSSFTELKEEELNKYCLENENEYKGAYNNIKSEFKKKYEAGDTHIYDGVTFETKIIEATDVIDEKYILNLIKVQIETNKKLNNNETSSNKLSKEQIKNILLKISSSPEYQNKQEAIEEFLESIDDSDETNSNAYDLLFNKLNKFKPKYAKNKLDQIASSNNLNIDGIIKLFKK